jgi:hypothetical protein
LVCALRLDGVAREGVGTGQSQVRQCADGLVPHHAGVVENLLELGGGSAVLVRRQISLATQINGVERDPPDLPQFIGRGRGERFEGLVGASFHRTTYLLLHKVQTRAPQRREEMDTVSKSNIIAILPLPSGDFGTVARDIGGFNPFGAYDDASGGVLVTFRTHRGTGTRTYVYSGEAARDIMNGADPADYYGELKDQG